jgi:hypothetical protein
MSAIGILISGSAPSALGIGLIPRLASVGIGPDQAGPALALVLLAAFLRQVLFMQVEEAAPAPDLHPLPEPLPLERHRLSDPGLLRPSHPR